MAIQEYKYQKTTHKDIESLIKWCQNAFNLRDWVVVLETSGTPPECFGDDTNGEHGKVQVTANLMKAMMWIPLELNKQRGVNSYAVTIHEMLHILTLGVTEEMKDSSDGISYRLEPLLYEYWCYKTKRKIAAVKP